MIPSVNGWGDLGGCLKALAAERAKVDLEVLVVDRVGEALRAKVREHFAWVHILEADEGTTIPDLRAIAFARATADAVAVIEDHVIVPAGWAEPPPLVVRLRIKPPND